MHPCRPTLRRHSEPQRGAQLGHSLVCTHDMYRWQEAGHPRGTSKASVLTQCTQPTSSLLGTLSRYSTWSTGVGPLVEELSSLPLPYHARVVASCCADPCADK